jgi:hypothetical protein
LAGIIKAVINSTTKTNSKTKKVNNQNFANH